TALACRHVLHSFLHDALPISREGIQAIMDAAKEATAQAREKITQEAEHLAEKVRHGAQEVAHRAKETGTAALEEVEHQVRERPRSEEHTSELQSRENLVCRLL